MAILNYLGFGGPAKEPVAEDKSPIRALPASWYTSEEMYQLERRAVFSKKWMLITHKSRFQQSGDWIKFEVAEYEFILSQKGDTIHGFHNVCRHRAYPVVEGQKGTARIFSCRYHGWSYGLDGKLAKAPKYDEFLDFDKSQNGMFKIHVKVDNAGFIWVNLDSSETPEPWEKEFAGIDMQERYGIYNFDDYYMDHEYTSVGPFNWKILADNFNECYHCPTSHPTIGTLADITTHDVRKDKASILHQSGAGEGSDMAISSTYYYPNVSTSVLKNFIMLQRFLPDGPRSAKMHYQIFRNKNSVEKDFRAISDLYAQVVSEDKVLCELAQRNLNAGIFINGQMHARLEKGPLLFQATNRRMIREHYELERKAGHEIWPARQTLPGSATVSQEDEDLCSGLACQTDQKGIAW